MSDEEPKKFKSRRRKGSGHKSVVKSIKKKKKTLAELTAKMQTEKIAKKRLENIQSKAAANVIEPETLFEELEYYDRKKLQERPVIFKPNPGPQTAFLAATEKEVLFAGGRGSGKTDALIIDPLRYCENKNFRGLIVRKTMPELRDLINRARDLYPQAFPGTKWKEQEKIFIFPSGAKMEFGYLENESDVERYRGQQYTWIGVDELTLFPKEETLDRLLSSLRTVDPTLTCYFRAATNPNGPGRAWVKRRFVDKGDSGSHIEVKIDTPIGPMVITRKWLNSKLQDNPILLDNNPQYMAAMANLPEALRRAWLDGDWNAADGVAFPDFNPAVHVVKPFAIPSSWLKFRCCDWGFTSMAVALWIACDEDSNLYVYREYKTKLVTADRFAGNVLELEKGERVRYGIIDSSVGDQRGISGPTVDEQMRMCGCVWRYADKGPGSRIAGKNLIHRYLAPDNYTGRPKLVIFDTCRELIEELSSLPIDDNDAEDVDTDCDDHAYDALRYGIMSRPNIVSAFEQWANTNPNPAPTVIDSTFGY